MKNIYIRITEWLSTVSPEKFFVITATIFGLLFLAITPPFQTPDEVAHFFRAYQASSVNLKLDDSHVPIPRSLEDTVTATSTNPIIKFDASKKYDGQKTIDALAIHFNRNDIKSDFGYNLALGSSYGPVSYLPQSVGIFIARIFNASPILFVYIGKLMNLLCWIGLFYLAIRLMPQKKWALVFIGLLPMGLFQAVSLGADALSIGLASLLVASVFYLRTQKTITHMQLGFLLLVSSAMVLTKQNMFIVLPILLLLPQLKSKSIFINRLVKLALILIPFILVSLWTLNAPGGSGQSFDSTSNNQQPAQQAKFVLKNPHSFANVIWNTYFFTWGDTVTRSFIGDFGWVDTPLSENIVVIGYIGLFLVLVGDYRRRLARIVSTRERLFILVIMIAFWMSVNAAMYLFYSPVGYKIIVGLQGRYLLPIAILLIPLLSSNWLTMSKRSYKNVAMGVPVFLLIASVITIYVRYYINNV